MYIVLTPDQFKAARKAAKKDLNAERPVIFLYNRLSDNSFELQTADVYIVLRYDSLENKLFADIGKKISLAAVVASDDQIFTHVADQLFTLIQQLTQEENDTPDEDEEEEEECGDEVDNPDDPTHVDINSDVDPENPPAPESPKSDS